MPPRFHTLPTATIRAIDRVAIEELELPGIVLMENAGRGIADLIGQRGNGQRVLLACGPGNNGGDGFVAARHLDNRGFVVHVLLTCEPARLRGDALANFRWLSETNVELRSCPANGSVPNEFTADDWIVDALLGTGVHGPPRPPLGALIQDLNRLPGRRLAVDLPSGLDADLGTPSADTFRAERTGTFVAAKPGLITPQARPFVGELQIIDIGVPQQILRRLGWIPDASES